MAKKTKNETESNVTIHHTVNGTHWIDRDELLRSPRAREIIFAVAEKLKVVSSGEQEGGSGRSGNPAPSQLDTPMGRSSHQSLMRLS